MTESTKIQLPIITKTLTNKEIRLHLLTLATNHSHHTALAEAKRWYEWVTETTNYEEKESADSYEDSAANLKHYS